MSYCTVSDVRSLVNTDLTDVKITNIITWADDWVDKHVDSGSATATYLENLSATYAAWRIMLKDPSARKLGEYAEDRGIMIKMLKDELDDLVASGGGGMSFTPAVETLG